MKSCGTYGVRIEHRRDGVADVLCLITSDLFKLAMAPKALGPERVSNLPPHLGRYHSQVGRWPAIYIFLQRGLICYSGPL